MLSIFGEATQSHLLPVKTSQPAAEGSDIDQPIVIPSSADVDKSLILIEEADIIFEDDKGFIQALKKLVSTSKRPIILTCNGMFFLGKNSMSPIVHCG